MVKIAVLVLNYNSQSFLKNCLESIQNQTLQDFDTYLIDNHSTDQSCEYVKKNFPEVKIIKHSVNFGIGHGFNKTIKELSPKYDYFCLFNPDISLKKHWLENIIKPFFENPNLEVCAGTILYKHNHRVDIMGGKVINLFFGIFGGIFGYKKLSDIPKNYKKNIFPAFFSVITGMAIRSSTFQKFGYFDEDYFMYYEDIDLCWRVLLGGGQIQTNPKAIMYHYGHGSIKNNQTQTKILGLSETNLLATYYKNLSLPGLIFLLPIVIVMRLLMSLVFLPTSPQITKTKIIGIYKFLLTVISKRLISKREIVQKLRQKSDLSLIRYHLSIPTLKTSIFKQTRLWVNSLNQIEKKFTHK